MNVMKNGLCFIGDFVNILWRLIFRLQCSQYNFDLSTNNYFLNFESSNASDEYVTMEYCRGQL